MISSGKVSPSYFRNIKIKPILRKLIIIILFTISLFRYLYKYGYIDSKGFSRLMISIRIVTIIALALSGTPNDILTQSEADRFLLPVSKPEISGKRLFQSSSKTFGSSRNPSSPDNENSEATPIKNSAEKSEKFIEHTYYHQSVEEDDDPSESDDQCLINDRLKIAVSKDGSMTKVRASKVRDKCIQIAEFISKNRFKGKFDVSKVKDLEYEDRLNYLSNKDNLPDEVVFEAQDEIVGLLSAEDTILVPGFLRVKKIPGTVFINLRLNQFGFRDENSCEYRTGGFMNNNKIRKLAESDFHLFSTAGE